MYTSEKYGSDEKGNGSESAPFKTVLKAMHFIGKEPFPEIYVDGKEEGVKYEHIAKAQYKKIYKIWVREQYKASDAAKKEIEDAENRIKNLEEAKKIIIAEDKSLPEPVKIKINQGKVLFFLKNNLLLFLYYCQNTFQFLSCIFC